MSKIFAIFKAKEKKNEKSPDYNISLKVGEHYVNVGGCWIKEGKSGKFLSCKLSEGYGDRKGFEMVQEKEQSSLTEEDKSNIAALRAGTQTKEAVSNDIDPDSIPF